MSEERPVGAVAYVRSSSGEVLGWLVPDPDNVMMVDVPPDNGGRLIVEADSIEALKRYGGQRMVLVPFVPMEPTRIDMAKEADDGTA